MVAQAKIEMGKKEGETGGKDETTKRNIMALIDEKNGKLMWQNPFFSPWSDTFHSPLAQLWFLWHVGKGITLEGVEKPLDFTDRSFSLPFPSSLLPPKIREGLMHGHPGELFDLILSDPEYSKTIRSLLCQAERILLAGAISPTSVHSVIHRLRTIRDGIPFSLTVVDLAEAPLRLVEAYANAGFWEGVCNVELAQLTLTEIGKEGVPIIGPNSFPRLGYFDVIVMDVLGIYQTPLYRAPNLARLRGYLNPGGGILLLRELWQRENLGRAVSATQDKDLELEEEFKHWLTATFGYEISLDEIRRMRNTLFEGEIYPLVPQEVVHIWEDCGNLELLSAGAVTPFVGEASYPTRVFHWYVFRNRALFSDPELNRYIRTSFEEIGVSPEIIKELMEEYSSIALDCAIILWESGRVIGIETREGGWEKDVNGFLKSTRFLLSEEEIKEIISQVQKLSLDERFIEILRLRGQSRNNILRIRDEIIDRLFGL